MAAGRDAAEGRLACPVWQKVCRFGAQPQRRQRSSPVAIGVALGAARSCEGERQQASTDWMRNGAEGH